MLRASGRCRSISSVRARSAVAPARSSANSSSTVAGLPRARRVIAVAVYAFMTAWGEILFASELTNQNSRTLAVGLQGYATQVNVYWNQVMAASLIVSVPVVAGFLFLQRYLIAGLTSGAVK